MAEAGDSVKRILQIKMRTVGDPAHVLTLVQSAAPFYRTMGAASFRVLQNVDDRGQIVIEIEYETAAALELNRHKVASDPMVRSFLQGWKAVLAGNAEMDVFEDVTG